MLLANFHALHHKSRHAIFTNVWDVQTTTKELLNILRNYSNELTKATGVETCASFYHTVGLQLLDRRNSTNNVAAFFSPPDLCFFPLTKATVKWLALLLVFIRYWIQILAQTPALLKFSWLTLIPADKFRSRAPVTAVTVFFRVLSNSLFCYSTPYGLSY